MDDALTRCAREVQMGMVDVCVAHMWETDARRSFTTFTSPIHIDVFRLVTKTHDVGFERERLIDFAKPFELNVWLVVIGTVVLGGILMGVVDDRSRYSVWMDTTRRGKALAALRWPARRFVMLGFAVFTLLISSLYFAWQAQFISRHSSDLKPALISSVADAIAAGRPLCMLSSSIGLVQRPGMKVEAVDSVWKALENVQSNRCIGAVIGGDEYLSYVTAQTARYDRCPAGQTDLCLDSVDLGTCLCTDPGKNPEECPAECPDYHRFCNLLGVPDPAFTPASSVALPVGGWLQDILSAWIVKQRLSGHVDKLRGLYVDDVNPPACKQMLRLNDSLPISLESLAGIFVVSGSLMLLGLLWHMIMECMSCSTRQPDISVAGGNYRADSVTRGAFGSMAIADGLGSGSRAMVPHPAEFRQEALSLADTMRNAVEQSTGRNEDRLIRQEERIVRQDRKLDELRAVIDDLNGKLGTEMAAETQNFETSLSAAVARLKVSEEEVLHKQRELDATHGAIQERNAQIEALQLQLQQAAVESVNIKQVVGERVGETFELKRVLGEREEEVQQLKEARAAMTEELMHAKGQLGEKTGQVHELRQQSDETRTELEQAQGRLNEALAELTRVKMQMDLQVELHSERERELSHFAGNNAVESLELRQQNEERWSELNKLREGAGERAGEMFELRQALNERTEEIIDLKGQLGERAWELLELKQQLGERAGEVLSANEKSRKADDELEESKSLCVEWRWQADELRKELDSTEQKIMMLSNENAKLFGDCAALRQENETLQEIAARHVEEKAELSETQTNLLEETASQKGTEIARLKEEKAGLEAQVSELKSLVGEYAAEVLEARSLLQVFIIFDVPSFQYSLLMWILVLVAKYLPVGVLPQDRCREVVDLEAKMMEKHEQNEALKKEAEMRTKEVEEQRQHLTVLWDLGSKVQTLMELDLGSKMQHMTEILQKVDCVLESKELPSDDVSPPPRYIIPKQNGGIATPLHYPPLEHAFIPHTPQRYEASNTFAPDTMASVRSMEASLPVPPIAFKPPQSAQEW